MQGTTLGSTGSPSQVWRTLQTLVCIARKSHWASDSASPAWNKRCATACLQQPDTRYRVDACFWSYCHSLVTKRPPAKAGGISDTNVFAQPLVIRRRHVVVSFCEMACGPRQGVPCTAAVVNCVAITPDSFRCRHAGGEFRQASRGNDITSTSDVGFNRIRSDIHQHCSLQYCASSRQ